MTIDYNQLRNTKVADVLLVTATEIETRGLLALFEPVCGDGILSVQRQNDMYNLGVLGGYNVVHCQCKNMGTQEVGSSMLTTTKALSDWPSVKCVIMVGVAFGMYNEDTDLDRQNYGDVLIAQSIFPYENQRLNPDGTEKYRGIVHTSNKNLLDAFTIVSRDWQETNYNGEPTKVRIVPLLTGEKLVDNFEWRNKLKGMYPDYKGGEMEGMGIAASSEKVGKPWILVKSICDFGDGTKGTTSEEEAPKLVKQQSAARLAALACCKALQTVNVKEIIGEKINYFYRDDIGDVDDILFLSYRLQCKPYYLLRKADEELHRHILTKHIWVTGKSGIGKSDLLRHALIESNAEYIYVDLSLCDKDNIDEMFCSICDTIAEHFNENVTSFMSASESIKTICEILEKKSSGNRLYVFIEELPFSEESEFFIEFVRKFAGLIIYSSGHLLKSKTVFVLSSIAMPKVALDTYRDKISDMVYFVSLDKWTSEECMLLLNNLSNALKIKWVSEVQKMNFVKSVDFSPRKIKNALKECCSLDYGIIDDYVLEKLNHG